MPYKITRSESYKADQTKSGESLKHYGRKGMKWDKNVFGKEDAPGQGRSSSNSGSAQSKKALSSALGSKVSSSGRGGGLNKNTLIQPEIPNSGRIMRVNNKSPFGIPSVEGYRTGKIPDPIIKSGGRGEAKPRSGLQKWFDQAGKDIGNTFNSAKKGVEDAANSVKKWGEGAVNDTKKWVEGAANDAKKWTDNAIKDIGKTAVKIGDDAKKAYGDAEKWVNGAIKDVGNAAVKVGDDAKKAYGDAKTFVDSLLRGEKAADYVDGRTGKVVKGEGYLPGKIEKAFNSAKDSVSRTASELADELVYGTKYAVGTARTAVKTAAGKVKDAYERVTDTGTQRLLNPKHMTKGERLAILEKGAIALGVAENIKKGKGPSLDEFDVSSALYKKNKNKPYNKFARFGQIEDRVLKNGLKSITPRPEPIRVINNRAQAKLKLIAPSAADVKKYIQGAGGIKDYDYMVRRLSKNPNDRTAVEYMKFFNKRVKEEKAKENKK